jgi:peptide chain release factor 3
MRAKHLGRALEQIAEEGAAQTFKMLLGSDWIVGVVGALQFDVVEARLESEYGIRCRIEPMPHVAARWPVTESGAPADPKLPSAGVLAAVDRRDRPVLIFESAWELRYTGENNPGVRFLDSR